MRKFHTQDGFVKYLEMKQVAYSNWDGASNKISHRADGVRQIYLQDPDGNWIEVNDAKYE